MFRKLDIKIYVFLLCFHQGRLLLLWWDGTTKLTSQEWPNPSCRKKSLNRYVRVHLQFYRHSVPYNNALLGFIGNFTDLVFKETFVIVGVKYTWILFNSCILYLKKRDAGWDGVLLLSKAWSTSERFQSLQWGFPPVWYNFYRPPTKLQ